jgi:hypothetical protein
MSQYDEHDQAQRYRSQAAECDQRAERERSLERKSELVLAAVSLRMLADNEDWLSGTVSRHNSAL